MKTIEQLEQEAKQAREDLSFLMFGCLPINKINAGIIADKIILASVSMMTYQLAQVKKKTTIDSEEFFNLMQSYRQVPLGDLSARVKYDAVIDYIEKWAEK